MAQGDKGETVTCFFRISLASSLDLPISESDPWCEILATILRAHCVTFDRLFLFGSSDFSIRLSVGLYKRLKNCRQRHLRLQRARM